MSISEKIEEIRQKPEHIRLRYVWIGVTVSMIFILFIWFFSLKNSFQSIPEENEQISELKNQLDSISK